VSPVDLLALAAVGFVAGVAGGTLGIGGGALFVPGLAIFYGLSQLDAQATSLLAMIPVAVVGAWRQARYGNLRLRDGLLVGALSPVGVVAGTLLATVLTERALELMFAALQLYLAAGLMRRALRPPETDAHADRV
jgi:uncharacterized membrane protein YfcA